MTSGDELLFLPLGGSGEIGMNLNLFGYGGKWIIVDLGVSFGEPNLPGIDLVMPDPQFIEDRREDLLGIVLTHAHEDHFGAVRHLWPRLRCPVYATPFTVELLRQKLLEADLLDQVPLHEVPLEGQVSLGPFDLRYITLTHSIVEPNALAITTPLGTVFHTGDWKIDPDPLIGEATDEAALRRLGEEGILAMICDSTNVFNDHDSGSEGAVRDSLCEVVAGRPGRVAVTAFASNIARLGSIAEAGRACGRDIVLVGLSMNRNVAAARAKGYLADFPPIVPPEEAGFLPPEKTLFICTGSQGEPRGAMARIAAGEHPNVTLDEGDTVIFSSKIIPGNELTLSALFNALSKKGIEVITEKDAFVHVSGHPGRNELSRMYQWIKPRISVPVHGEARHLAEHARLAEELQVPQCVVPENGTLIRLAPGPAEIIDYVENGRLVLDGNRLVPAEGDSVVGRRRMMYNGHVVVSLAIDGEGRLLAPPGLSLTGVPDEDELRPQVVAAIERALGRLAKDLRRDDVAVAEVVRVAARRACRDFCTKRPVTEVQILRLPGQRAASK